MNFMNIARRTPGGRFAFSYFKYFPKNSPRLEPGISGWIKL